ncbi:hypothetical protein Aph02nite_49980 [Actinoplanes philippinensis]|uniref:MAE-28990/MAE-18760-like HEPN domain-containing protein n=1 Tax=Actinoplanes philippinensis TaxID=35752 RepID=A0A1I2IUD8_9ACTN|nr:MAE_28990/MAE_18760 family HEPN-like nuclease [Actinoplanes philippinensis]GIE79048.1 hypothetical protein Aph02nite_49980 [Actinoplanes philippinensis]SFF44637.1 hypothetical protein SAMN05421541_110365 [Actinoplanes philippinensis]
MSVNDLLPFFEERFEEVSEYLDLLTEIETAAQSGPPRIAVSEYRITAPQQRILYSSVYLQLYNLVEATVARCLEAITEATQTTGEWRPHQLNDELQREWVRAKARTHVELAPENRLRYALELSSHITDQLPIGNFAIEAGGGGNWDDEEIFRIGKRVGCEISVSREVNAAVKRRGRDNVGALKLVRNRRNSLAHGSVSFVECAADLVVSELRETANNVGDYLREVIGCFIQYIDSFVFLRVDHRPGQGAA